MPELPEVYVRHKYFDKNCLRHKITKIEVYNDAILYKTNATALNRALKGKAFTSSQPYGKFLFAALDTNTALAIHFGMTGNLIYHKPDQKKINSAHLIIFFDNGYELAYTDPRRLGNIGIVENLNDLIEKRKLGPDALHITQSQFQDGIANRSGKIKPLLLDQSFLAGIGNVYADEILFQSKIHPESLVRNFEQAQYKAIYTNTILVLKKMVGLDAQRAKLDKHYLIPVRQAGSLCPRKDGGSIEVKTVGGRSTYFCKECQVKY